MMSTMCRALPLGMLALVAALPAFAQSVEGRLFEDRDDDGVLDPGEPTLQGVVIDLVGTPDAGGTFDQSATTGADGVFSFAPGDGCYLLRPRDPAGWRRSPTRSDAFPETTPGYAFPVGEPRFGKLDQAMDHLRAGQLRYASAGDSIAWNWNSCFFVDEFWYSKQVRSRLACAFPSATVTLVDDGIAVKGEHTDDLLLDDHEDRNNVFRMVELQPELITISMIGNDLLDVEPGADPTPEETNRAVLEVLDARQNLQEAVSSLLAEIPAADITLNTLYDNDAWDCYTGAPSDFHRQWIPIVNRILRDLAWGQIRRVGVNEVAAEFAHENQASECAGFDRMICRDFFQTDNIHPNNDGYTVVREKVWESVGGVNLGSRDALGRSAVQGIDYGYLRRVRRLLPTTWETRGGASVGAPEAALDDQDGGASGSITLGAGEEEFRLAGFPDWFDEIRIVRVVSGVRYRTGGTVGDDEYRMEASVTGQFRPDPGFDYSPTHWNFYTPIVGGGGPSQPADNPDYPGIELLAFPDVADYREVSATLTKNPVLEPGAPEYSWPPLTHEDLATTAIRVASAPVGGTPGNDGYTVELDAAWLDLYGWEKPRPGEAGELRVDGLTDGSLEISFEPVAGAQRYNVYFGRLSTLSGGAYDHGASAPAGPLCDAPTESTGDGRLRVSVDPSDQPSEDAYVLVTAHADDVESPAGHRSDGTEIDRSQSVCR